MGTGGGGDLGRGCPSLEFKNDDVICCFHVKYPKTLLAPSAFASNTLKIVSTVETNAGVFACAFNWLENESIF